MVPDAAIWWCMRTGEFDSDHQDHRKHSIKGGRVDGGFDTSELYHFSRVSRVFLNQPDYGLIGAVSSPLLICVYAPATQYFMRSFEPSGTLPIKYGHRVINQCFESCNMSKGRLPCDRQYSLP
jgi:hypothetical protein